MLTDQGVGMLPLDKLKPHTLMERNGPTARWPADTFRPLEQRLEIVLDIVATHQLDKTPAAGLGYVSWLGHRVTAAYVIQWLLIGNIATAIYKSQTLTETVLWYALILGITTVLLALTDRVKGRRVHDGSS